MLCVCVHDLGVLGEIFALGCFENLKKQVRYGYGLAGVKNNGYFCGRTPKKKYMMSVVTATLLIAIVATLLLVHYDGPAAE